MAPKSSVVSTPSGQSHARSGRALLGRLWYRQLDHYPDNGPRAVYLAIVVLVTITLYYQLYVQFSVSTLIIRDFGMTFTFFVYISVVGNAIGAFASLAAGLADRWGRANLVTYGLLVTSVLVLVGLPNAPNKVTYLVLYAAVSLVEGMLLVATPALIRDFSPQLGRASAMGFWTLGPVIGGLVVTEVSSNTLGSHPHWQTQFYYAGAAGLVMFAVALVGLRELSPSLRDQLMVSLRDRALIEARAAGLDVDAALAHHWRQMLKLDVIGSAFAISVFLLFYYTVVGFFVVYFATTFGFTEAQANSLGNWYWAFNAAALVFSGIVSDLLRVRKPLMIVGAVGSIVVTSVFALQTTHPHTTYHTFALIIALIAVFGGITFAPWMARPAPSAAWSSTSTTTGASATTTPTMAGPCSATSPGTTRAKAPPTTSRPRAATSSPSTCAETGPAPAGRCAVRLPTLGLDGTHVRANTAWPGSATSFGHHRHVGLDRVEPGPDPPMRR
jgi:MFS family permease